MVKGEILLICSTSEICEIMRYSDNILTWLPNIIILTNCDVGLSEGDKVGDVGQDYHQVEGIKHQTTN